MKILIATPVYDGKLPIQVVHCLLGEKDIAHGCGDELGIGFLGGCSHAAQGRNQLADDFLKSDCDRLVFLDSDVTWAPGDLIKIAHQPVDFVGGAYRHKTLTESYPVHFDSTKKELWANERGLLEVMAVPGGFMSLSRNVFEKIKEANPNRIFDFWGRKMFCFFEMSFKDGTLGGEDFLFCESFRKVGGKIYLDPELNLIHWDQKMTPYEGHIGKWLKNRNGIEPVRKET